MGNLGGRGPEKTCGGSAEGRNGKEGGRRMGRETTRGSQRGGIITQQGGGTTIRRIGREGQGKGGKARVGSEGVV